MFVPKGSPTALRMTRGEGWIALSRRELAVILLTKWANCNQNDRGGEGGGIGWGHEKQKGQVGGAAPRA